MHGHVVVTGAAGFIGSHLCDRLLADGRVVVGVDSFEDYYGYDFKVANLKRARESRSFTLLRQNVLAMDLASILDGASCIFHLAGQAGVRASWGASFETYARNNILATQRLLDASLTAAVPKVVYASSSSVYGNQDELPLREDMMPMPRSPYGVTKLAAEHLCVLYSANHGLDTTSLRFFTVYGPRQRPDMAFNKFIRAMLEDRDIVVYGDGTQTRDFTFVDDVVEGLVRAPGAPAGSVLNIGGGNQVTLAAAVETLAQIAGMRPRLLRRPQEAGDVMDTLADVTRIAEILDFRPNTTLAVGLEKEFAWLKSASGETATQVHNLKLEESP